jgi:hypothetical protein
VLVVNDGLISERSKWKKPPSSSRLGGCAST